MTDSAVPRLRAELRAQAEPRVREQQVRVLTGANGDVLLGVRVPVLRRLARGYRDLSLDDVDALLRSPVHEERFAGLLVLAERVRTARGEARAALVDFYLARTAGVNDWDLVDGSAPVILGPWLLESGAEASGAAVLDRLAASASVWDRRIAVVATLALIRAGRFEPTFRLVLALRRDPEPLVHKALGWMLRDIGRRAPDTLVDFLDRHAAGLPRVTVRHATERLNPADRSRFVRTR
ncbi:DNA alkylation repair protein [Actinocorallia aurea]